LSVPPMGFDLTDFPPLDLGDVRIAGTLEESQEALGSVIAELLKRDTIPVIMGGGHETAYGHYLGYVGAGKTVDVVNVDAHLDVRAVVDGKGHSGSPFRQMIEHPTQPLRHYYPWGIRPGVVSRADYEYAWRICKAINFFNEDTFEFEDKLQKS